MSYYLQKVNVMEHRLEELGQEVKETKEITEQDIENKLFEFRDFMDSLTSTSTQEDSLGLWNLISIYKYDHSFNQNESINLDEWMYFLKTKIVLAKYVWSIA